MDDGRREILGFLGPLEAMAVNRLEVIFEEIIFNIIRHGFERNSSQCIHVVVERTPGAVQLTFEDDGIPYNLLAATLPPPATSLETAKIGGLGIPLIVKMASKLHYEELHPIETREFRPRNRVIVTVAA